MPKGSATTVNCPYCHASVVVPEELRQDPGAANWSTLVYDGFISNHNDWLVGSQTSEYFAPLNRTITEGRYRWEAQVGKAPGITTAWLKSYPVSDFHLIANCKHILGSRANSSCGVIFRIQDNNNYYHFHITDSHFFAVSVLKDGQWVKIVNWTQTNTIKPNGVNQLEVFAQEKHFTFLINGQIVTEVNDDRFDKGLVGLAIEAYTPAEKIAFDFLDFTLRAQETLTTPLSKRKFSAADLVPGKTYHVIKPFTDYDGTVHPVGESWRFVKKGFSPHEDGLSLFVERNGQTVLIRLQWLEESQGEIIDNFSDFVTEG
jgi:hypothetical protein